MPRQSQSDKLIAQQNWDRYQYGRNRGHRTYIAEARLNERFYLGGGLQWRDEDRQYLEGLRRPVIELNHIWPAVHTAAGLQMQNRVNIAYKPRNSPADDRTAETLSKLAMYLADRCDYQWLESQVYQDGMIQQRGYLDVRISYDDNLHGEVVMTDLDPMDVIPDPDANTYDPRYWTDVIVTRWMSLDDIEGEYGRAARNLTESYWPTDDRFGAGMDEEDRNQFGDGDTSTGRDLYDSFRIDGGIRRVRVIDRQYWELQSEEVAVYPGGDIFPVPDETSDRRKRELARAGVQFSKRRRKVVRWCVTTRDTVLYEDDSPYQTFTVIPFFGFFRRGKTRGMVDNLRSPQELLNKTASQSLHVVNTTANSGWLVEEDSLTNMTTEDLEAEGAKTGLVVEYRKGSQPPVKIQPNAIPAGLERIAEKGEAWVRTISGVSEAVQGLTSPEVSGIAVQAKQYAAQMQFAVPLDNLARTRHLVGAKLLELIQDFYTASQVFLITEEDLDGNKQEVPLAINQPQANGTILNDLTVGKYDVVISDTPVQSTFRDTQFQQAVEMRKIGVGIPDSVLIQNSNLTRKQDILETMQGQPDPRPLADAEQKQAQADKARADTLKAQVDAAQVLATVPATAQFLPETIGLSQQQQPTPEGVPQ